jgi:hypothetical protein
VPRPSALDAALAGRAGPLAGGLLLVAVGLVALLAALVLDPGPLLLVALLVAAAWGAVVGGGAAWSARR